MNFISKLKDIHGIKIRQGDFIKDSSGKIGLVIIQDDGKHPYYHFNYAFMTNPTPMIATMLVSRIWRKDVIWLKDLVKKGGVEYIGNIKDNPELLKEVNLSKLEI